MKKLFALSCAALALAACTSEENSLLGGDSSSNQSISVTEVSAITRGFNDGSVNVTPGNKAGNDMSVVYVRNQQGLPIVVDKNISWNYVNVICNKGTGFFHGENGWAVKNEAAGTLDNNRMTYSWFINDNGDKQGVEPNTNSQGLLLTGSNCNLSKFNQNGNRAIVNIGDEWFDNSFARAEEIIAEALKGEGEVVNYGGQNPNEVSDLTYTQYTWMSDDQVEYKVIVIDQTHFTNGAVAETNDKAKAPWCEGNWNTFANDHDITTMDHNVILVPMNDVVFEGRNMNCHIFAPGKKITINGGACPSGLVICDELVANSEIHGTWTPFREPKDPEPPIVPPVCNSNLLVNLNIDASYIVIADDFAIQNGDKLYMNAAIEGYEHEGVPTFGGQTPYLKVEKGDNVHIAVDNVCDLYESYIGKTDEEGNSYINEVGELTLVVYLWPGILNEDGKFESYLNLGEAGYIIGDVNKPVQHTLNNEDYSIMVSAYKGYQGRGEKLDGTVDNNGWSYIKVSIHISPRAKVELPVAAN